MLVRAVVGKMALLSTKIASLIGKCFLLSLVRAVGSNMTWLFAKEACDVSLAHCILAGMIFRLSSWNLSVKCSLG